MGSDGCAMELGSSFLKMWFSGTPTRDILRIAQNDKVGESFTLAHCLLPIAPKSPHLRHFSGTRQPSLPL